MVSDINQYLIPELVKVSQPAVDYGDQDIQIDVFVAMNEQVLETYHVAVGVVVRECAQLNASFYCIDASCRWSLSGKQDETLADIHDDLDQDLKITFHCAPGAPVVAQLGDIDLAQGAQFAKHLVQRL
jgi:hypothetical protein